MKTVAQIKSIDVRFICFNLESCHELFMLPPLWNQLHHQWKFYIWQERSLKTGNEMSFPLLSVWVPHFSKQNEFTKLFRRHMKISYDFKIRTTNSHVQPVAFKKPRLMTQSWLNSIRTTRFVGYIYIFWILHRKLQLNNIEV